MKPVWTPSRVPTSQTVEHASTIEFLIPQNSAGYTLTIPLLLPEQLVSASILIKTLPTSSKLTLMKCCSEAQKQIAAQVMFCLLIWPYCWEMFSFPSFLFFFF